MRKTVLITGASSGIGQATALFFHERDWNVIATMRNPEKSQTLLHEKGLPDLVHLDVMDRASIQTAIQYALDKYQKIDVLVNNAGYALYGPFEVASTEQIQKQFETNVFGLMEMTRAILPQFRAQQDGVLINVSSMGGRIGFPLYSVYNSSKFAVEGYSEALHYELRDHNIRVKIIEPGVIRTDFFDRSMDHSSESNAVGPYARIVGLAEKVKTQTANQNGTAPDVVARVIFKAAQDRNRRLRYVVGSDAKLVNIVRSIVPEQWLFNIIRKYALG